MGLPSWKFILSIIITSDSRHCFNLMVEESFLMTLELSNSSSLVSSVAVRERVAVVEFRVVL